MGFPTFSVFLMVTADLLAQQGPPKAKAAPATVAAPNVNFVDLAESAGLTAKTEAGGDKSKKYIIETTGSGAAFVDLDHDGWPDAFLVNGTRLEGFGDGQEATSHLYHNNHDGTFKDVTSIIRCRAERLGTRSLCRRLRQRWRARFIRDVLGTQRPSAQ